jgi:hypothetical protein
MTRSAEQRLRELLESYGADLARWPAADRALAGDRVGLQWQEARETDALLSAASSPPERSDLAERIGRLVEPSRVVPFDGRKRRTFAYWPAAAALAASFALGLYIGAANTGDILFPSTDTASLDDPLDLIGGDQSDTPVSGDSV